MTWNIPDFMAESVQPVELSLNMDIAPERYCEIAEFIIAYISRAIVPPPKGKQFDWQTCASAVSDLLLFDGKKLTADQFGQLIHGEWSTLDNFMRYVARVMENIGRLAQQSGESD